MLRNYLKIAYRNLLKSKGYAAINVIGIGVAVCICLFLFLIAYLQLTFDAFHTDSNRIFQTYFANNDPESARKSGTMPIPLTPALKVEYPEIEAAARIIAGRKSLIEYQGKYFDKLVTLTDPDFMKVFSFPLLKGNREAVLQELSSIVLSENTAKAIFGNDDPIGKSLKIGNEGNQKQYIVTGILSDAPYNSTIQYDALIRVENLANYQSEKDNWSNNSHLVFVKTNPQVTQASFENRLKSFAKKYYAGVIETLVKKGVKPDERGDLFTLRLQPLANVHFARDIDGGKGTPIALIYVLLGIGFFILLIACINFINLSIARSFTRAKEMGVRKSLGALKKQLFIQIWSESTIICFIGFGVGILLAFSFLSEFNAQFNAKIQLEYAFQPGFMVVMLFLFVLVTFIAGGYPAWQMIKFNPVEVLKGKVSLKRPGLLRNSLLVVQFSMSCLLACATIIALQQVGYLRQQPLGFQKEQVISIPVGNYTNGRQVLQRMRNKLANDPAIVSVTGTGVNLGKGKDRVSSRSVVGFTYKGRKVATDWLLVDYDYLKTLNIKVAAGRDFDPAYPSDSVNRLVITESMANAMGEMNPVGLLLGDDGDTTSTKSQIIGVVPDFHLYSLTSESRPITMHISNTETIHYIFVRVTPQSLVSSMDKLKNVWKEVAPQAEFMGTFLDKNIDDWYQDEEMMSQVFSLAAGIAIFLSCLGLFAVALLVIEQRTKEIGIRKVLGAGLPNLVIVLSKDFIKLILIALTITIPLAWFLMQKWLDSYTYRIEISAWIFAGVGASAIIIALITVSFQTLKAALTNPINSLKSE
ncbi:ABC-type antimicrobial peptide transport system permease subunit [Runella defluvii]|uniref:ABC-type antimicrobial peptide transport system permease subunit n=1 Tax=Runella defluvii TaxID=370973 RepID=A0A7W5ZNL6_9BACT|nr:ABC transporter permease [Runella defluvii]MBB3840264.1 ABC-type antimicrobial peptide transport system permease subunit [Runella defluvii]